MSRIASALIEFGGMDSLAAQAAPAQRIDPRAKVLAALPFIVAVVSFPRHALGALLPFCLFPVALAALGNVPTGMILRRVMIAAPFACVVGIFNPIFERETMLRFGDVAISAGWVSFASILLRFLLTVATGLILIATTGFRNVCFALDRLGCPRALTLQFMMLYRYCFLLGDEALRIRRAWGLRSGLRNRPSLGEFSALAGQLFLRAYDRAHRIHGAMLSRGFTGEIRIAQRLHFRFADAVFLAGWIAFFALARFQNLTAALGHWIMGGFA